MVDANSQLKIKLYFLRNIVDSLFKEKGKLSLSELKYILKKKEVTYLEDELLFIINELLTDREVIVRNDFWDRKTEYLRLDEHLEMSSYAKYYYSFKVDNYETKKFLLISDTHIGNDDMEDFKLLNNLYDYAIANGAKKCFHLGDLFAGDFNQKIFDSKEKESQITKFINNYPKPLPDEMMTYGLQGNHDMQIDSKISCTTGPNIYYDLRQLNYYNTSFYMFPRERWTTDFLDKKFHFSHRFHHSMLIKDLNITCMDDIINENNWLDWTYDVHISGHLHKGLIYGAPSSKYTENQQLFLGVPSTSKLNLNNIVGYLVTLNYSEKEITSMNISVLNSNNNYQINEQETIDWEFNNSNDIQQKAKIFK